MGVNVCTTFYNKGRKVIEKRSIADKSNKIVYNHVHFLSCYVYKGTLILFFFVIIRLLLSRITFITWNYYKEFFLMEIPIHVPCSYVPMLMNDHVGVLYCYSHTVASHFYGCENYLNKVMLTTTAEKDLEMLSLIRS